MTTPKMMLVSCLKRHVESFVDEFGDWKEEGAEVKLFGYTSKSMTGSCCCTGASRFRHAFTKSSKRMTT